MDPDRRSFLQLLAALASTTAIPSCSDDPAPAGTDAGATSDLGPNDAAAGDAGGADVMDAGSAEPDVLTFEDAGPREDVPVEALPMDPGTTFIHGVASGDPLPTAVILWTRVSPSRTAPPADVMVTWEISTSPMFTAIAAMGTFTTTAMRDWTVKVDATGLTPGTTYYYRFRALGETSPVGRTRTAPQGMAARVRFAVVSCSNRAFGWFHAYRKIARRADLDAVIHLGDYIYEYGDGEYGGARRLDPPTECRSLDDYRRRYRVNRRDPDVRAIHQQHAMIAVWDDHEFADNAWQNGANKHMPAMDGDWSARRRAAEQAYAEWMPIREQMDGRIFRKLSYGDLMDLVMLDTRIWGRDEQATFGSPAVDDPNRQLLGMTQEMWLRDQLTTSTARWRVLGQQVMLSVPPTILPNSDGWEGYRGARNRFFSLLRDMRVMDVVVLTGDIHSSWAFDLTDAPRDPMRYNPDGGVGSLGVEFVCPAVSSPGFPTVVANAAMRSLGSEPHIKWANLVHRGYTILDVTPERVQCAWYLFERVDTPRDLPESLAAVFSARYGERRLRPDALATPPATAPALAPFESA